MNAVLRGLLDVLFANLWQGICIALAVVAVLAFSGRRLNAATRYIILQGALVAIALVPLATALPNAMQRASIQGGQGIAGPHAARGVVAGFATAARRIDVPLDDRAVLMLAAAWIAGVLVFTLRIGAGSLQLARIIRHSKRLANRGHVRVYASPDIEVPLAAGFKMQSVIVPTALAAESGEEFECIMLHELAHVRRGDAWMNACERTLHALLFFNPAVLLMLRAIALEREAACDDRAVAQSRDLDAYTRSLASFAVRRADIGFAAACGVSGFARATVTRIQRLEDARRNGAITLSHYALGGFTLMLAIIALTLTSFAPAIAFAPQTAATPRQAGAPTAATPNACSHLARYLTGPPPQVDRPAGLKAQVLVRLSSAGNVMSAVISKSSGNAAFDQAVIVAAKKGTYGPEVQNCKPVAGTYLFDAETTA